MAEKTISSLIPDNDFAKDDLIEISKDIGGQSFVTRSVKKSDFMPIVTHAAVMFNWENNQSTQTILAQFNVASVDTINNRTFRINFTTALNNLNYYPSANCNAFGPGGGLPFIRILDKNLNYVDIWVSTDVSSALSRDNMFIEIRGFE